ncbi:hypothetical protein BDP27DRAFT_1426428 [Rhodocollybia butyracea]|uniref:Uncharacterized protein n=1 Tax=Rhodocollybia butyracea TaxID=206335 RepID=A0A9P5PDW6_9AGAR|nr:hypothetical protein BDP27DRAFT_1426428 [Rhodocollybia butyracea]
MFLTNNIVVLSESQATVNRSIDDGFGDSVTGLKPVFLPTTGGLDIWRNETCPPSICTIIPPTSSAFDETYTQSTVRAGEEINITFDFTGVALYVFFIIANIKPPIQATTIANFTLDGSLVGNFYHEPDSNAPEFQFNILAFSKTDLQNTNHEMIISAMGSSEPIVLIFDYALYTFMNALPKSNSSSTNATSTAETSSTSSCTSTAHLGVAGFVGVLVGVAGTLIAVYCYRQRCRKQSFNKGHPARSAGNSESGSNPAPAHAPSTGLQFSRQRDLHRRVQEMNEQIEKLRAESAELSGDFAMSSTSELGNLQQQRAVRLDVAQLTMQIQRTVENIVLPQTRRNLARGCLNEAPPGYSTN